ncbi:MAG: M48 family metalloprotease [Candidatus Altiarchaeales archaeon]|nr:M48 family metalloprotease [Candidatus Altiarchaeales archaeon]MBD3417301.1 M48 family metalloprotease [Candidatus Altiarchaeales archaeon]
MADRKSFYDQIDSNKRNSWILVFVVMVTLGFLTLAIGGIIAYNWNVGVMFIFLMFASVFNIAYILYTYYNSDKVALKSVNAYEADPNHPNFSQLHHIIEEMAIAGGMPKPRVYVMPTQDINAFATGRDPEHSVVCVTEGCLMKLNRQELQSVIAHEMTHIRNYDIRFVTLVAVMVGLVSIISQMFLRSLWYGSMFGGGRRRGGGGGNVVFLLLGIVLAIVAPLIVKLVQLAISRKREYMADGGAVELTRYPEGMISALKKIEADYAQPRKHSEVSAAVAPMFLADPTKHRITSLFQTHPPIADRIKALQAM